MHVVHLGGSPLGDRISSVLSDHGDHPQSATTIAEARLLLAEHPDWLVSAGFRHILTSDDLAMAGDTVNVHTSYLPHGRGANPNVWAIVDEEPAGVSLHRMVSEVDAGPLWAQAEVGVTFGDTGETLYRKLEDAAVALFAARWPEIRNRTLDPYPQPPGGSRHRSEDFLRLSEIHLDEQVTWRRAFDVLRALTFPPHHNIVVHQGERRWSVRLHIEEVDS